MNHDAYGDVKTWVHLKSLVYLYVYKDVVYFVYKCLQE